MEETVEAFDRLVTAGKIRFAGSSVFPAELLVESQWAAERSKAAAFVSEQAPYSIFVRGIERAVLPTCRQYGLGVLVWSPLNGGWLTGKYRRGQPVPPDSRAGSGNPFVRADDAAKLDRVEQLAKIAEGAGLTLSQMSLAWTLEHPGGFLGAARSPDGGATRPIAERRRRCSWAKMRSTPSMPWWSPAITSTRATPAGCRRVSGATSGAPATAFEASQLGAARQGAPNRQWWTMRIASRQKGTAAN